MAKLKSFDQYISEMDRSEEIEKDLEKKTAVDSKSVEEVEDEAETVQEAEDATPLPDLKDKEEAPIPVYGMLEKCYEAVIKEASNWAGDEHDGHTIESYMAENSALVAKMGVNALTELKEEMATEAYEACLNKMAESYTNKINESKETKTVVDAEDIG